MQNSRPTQSQDTQAARFNTILSVSVVLIFLPTWLWLINAWLSDPYYTHGPLVPIISAYLSWAMGLTLRKYPTRPSNWGLAILVVALIGHLWATFWRAYYVSALMFPFVILGLVVSLYGWQTARRLYFPLAFLVLMVPLPLAERVGPMLGSWTAASATALAQTLGVPARNVGSEVTLPNSSFTVGIQCGGLSSAVAILTLAALLAYIVKGAGWSRVLLLLLAVPIALVANTIRIALLFAIASVWGAEAALGYYHDWSSPLLFLLAFGLLILLAGVLRCSNVRWEVVFPQ